MKIARFFIIILIVFFAKFAHSADPEDATQAANEILGALHSRSFDDLWNAKTSGVYKKNITKESFMANMALGRNPLGNVTQSPVFVDMGYAKSDPATGFVGEIYAFNFLTSYAVGRFYERVVVIKEADGKFRMAGLFGAPAP